MMSVHVDVDSPWVYEREYGVSFADQPSAFFERALPRALELFERHRIRATFFIVGRDLEWECARQFCRTALQRGHAIGNHTYAHPVMWRTLSAEEKRREIQRCHDAIVQATGQRPVGFRAPGYAVDRDVVDALRALGYTYDSSVLPGIATLAMAVHQWVRGHGAQGKAFGRAWYAFAARRPRIIRGSDAQGLLYELPIAVLPLFRTPIHTTFLYVMGRAYTRLAQWLCARFPDDRTFLFHAIDFADDPDPATGAQVIVPFRWTHEHRIALAGELCASLATMGGGNIMTTESQLADIRKRHISTSFLLSHFLTTPADRSYRTRREFDPNHKQDV